MKNDNEFHKHGRSDWATLRDFHKAGLLTTTDNSLHMGFASPAWRHRIRYNDDAGVVVVAGPRSGKHVGIGGYNAACGFSKRTQVFFDIKAEAATTAQDQTAENRKCAYWAPYKRFNLAQHKINPLGHIRIDSPRLHADIGVFCENAIPETGGGNAKFFELSARGIASPLALAITERDGELSFPRMGEAVQLLDKDTPEAYELEHDLMTSRFPEVRDVYSVVMEGKKSSNNTWQSVLAELRNAFACMSDPALRETLSPPFDMTLEQITVEGRWNLYLMPESDFIQLWSPVIRTFFSTLKTLMERHRGAPKQDWIIDEAAKLAPFPMLPDIYNFGAGLGIRCKSFWQSFEQMDAVAPNGSALIPAGAGMQVYFGIREIKSAEILSKILGYQTLRYNDSLAQSRAKRERRQIFDAMMRGADPMKAGREIAHLKRTEAHRSEMQRLLKEPSEIIRMNKGEAILITDKMRQPGLIQLDPYFERREMAKRYTENKAHSQDGGVTIQTLFGERWISEVVRPAPEQFREFPQYADGTGVFLAC